ncbi:MAG TPA: Gfo/Idh/MocA family oxidoreductase, partial [bacterium]|nr:Gfo/Idh/MocA family oxidoreductase [bacterium]
CDVDPDTLQAVSTQYGVPGFSSHGELLSSGKVDAVVIATPHYFHPPIGIDAFDAGMHVLTEKPMAVTIGAAEKFAAKARESKKVFTIMFQKRFSGAFQTAKKLVEEKAIGELYRVSMIATGFRTQRYYDSGAWRATWLHEGGGVIINQASHELDFFTALVGLPSQVCAKVRTRLHRIEVEDFGHCIMEFPNGAVGYLCISTDEAPGTHRIELCGDSGRILIDGNKILLSRLDTPSLKDFALQSDTVWGSPKAQTEEVAIPDGKANHGHVLQNFVNTILGKEELVIDGAVGLTELELGNAIHLSSHIGKAVELPLDRQQVEDHFAQLRRISKPKASISVARETDPQHLQK